MYEQQNNIECAKMCFWRAYCVGDVEGTALFSLARCYEKSGNDCEAAAAYTQFIRQCEARGVSCLSSHHFIKDCALLIKLASLK